MTLPASDTFAGTNGQALTAYSASWTNSFGAFVIEDGAVVGNNASDESGAYWNADSFNANQKSQIVVGTLLNGTDYIGPAVRMTGSGNYVGTYSSNANSELVKVTNGTYQLLDTGSAWAPGDTVRLEASGTSFKVFVNNVEVMSANDATHTGGAAGICGWNNGGGASAASWTADNLGGAGGGSSPRNLLLLGVG